MWPYRQKPIKISYHPANFTRHRHCSSGDIMVIVYHVILQDHVIKGSCDVMDRSPSRWVTILPSLVFINTLVLEIWFEFVTWSWCDDVTIICLISHIWVKSCRCTKFGDHRSCINGNTSVGIKSYIDTFFNCWTHHLDPPNCKIFKIRNTNLQFWNPGYCRQIRKEPKDYNYSLILFGKLFRCSNSDSVVVHRQVLVAPRALQMYFTVFNRKSYQKTN